jgi:hypothetical protein
MMVSTWQPAHFLMFFPFSPFRAVLGYPFGVWSTAWQFKNLRGSVSLFHFGDLDRLRRESLLIYSVLIPYWWFPYWFPYWYIDIWYIDIYMIYWYIYILYILIWGLGLTYLCWHLYTMSLLILDVFSIVFVLVRCPRFIIWSCFSRISFTGSCFCLPRVFNFLSVFAPPCLCTSWFLFIFQLTTSHRFDNSTTSGAVQLRRFRVNYVQWRSTVEHVLTRIMSVFDNNIRV